MRELALSGNNEPDEARLIAAILRYLAEHPRAMDTFDGIAEWWVMREQVRAEVAHLERAIQHLTAQGVIQEVLAGAEVYYCLRAQ